MDNTNIYWICLFVDTAGQSPWQLLPWSQTSLLLDHPQLSEALLSKNYINTAHWLRGQLDHLAQVFNLQLLPPSGTVLSEDAIIRGSQSSGAVMDRAQAATLPLPMQSYVEQFEDVVSELSMSDLEIPSYARATVLDVPFGDHAVRLYLIIWDSSTPSQPHEWSLTTILGIVPATLFPGSIHLTIADAEECLDDQSLPDPTPESYLCSKVIGDWQEQFWITIDANGVESLTLPPLTYFPTTD